MEIDERKVWQRVRGETPDQTQLLREWLAEQAPIAACYRNLSRRGGKFQLLHEHKHSQINALRGLLRLLTGQGVARPQCREAAADLKICFAAEVKFYRALDAQSREGEFGPVFASLRERQREHCRILAEVIGTM